MKIVIFLSSFTVCMAGWPWGGYGGGGNGGGYGGGGGGAGAGGGAGTGENSASSGTFPLYAHCQVRPNAAKMDAASEVEGQKVQGWVDIEQRALGELKLRVSLSGLTPSSTHGFHVHEYGDLSDGCESTMSHYNPFDEPHGAPTDAARHVGDLGNVNSDDMGEVNVEIIDEQVALTGIFTVIGRAIVVHAKADDLGRGGDEDSLKTGNAGSRLACCVIGVANGTTWENNPAGLMTTLIRRRNLQRLTQP